MGTETRVLIIDHHQPRENLPAHWIAQRGDTGATTTLLVEALRERDGALSTVQATLLLLGIYEDTGSLTYTRTSSRDLRAAAFLLDLGANLGIVSDFLKPSPFPHTTDNLRFAAKSCRVSPGFRTDHRRCLRRCAGNGGRAFDNCPQAARPAGSGCALRPGNDPRWCAADRPFHERKCGCRHYLNEFWWGEAIKRAAAGLVRGRSLDDVKNELIRLLPRFIHPAITVAQIMSREPQVLTPSTPVEEAAQKMSRFGYEGYPVVQNGKVIGLLTRRAVDRAVSHNLHKTATV